MNGRRREWRLCQNTKAQRYADSLYCNARCLCHENHEWLVKILPWNWPERAGCNVFCLPVSVKLRSDASNFWTLSLKVSTASLLTFVKSRRSKIFKISQCCCLASSPEVLRLYRNSSSCSSRLMWQSSNRCPIFARSRMMVRKLRNAIAFWLLTICFILENSHNRGKAGIKVEWVLLECQVPQSHGCNCTDNLSQWQSANSEFVNSSVILLRTGSRWHVNQLSKGWHDSWAPVCLRRDW